MAVLLQKKFKKAKVQALGMKGGLLAYQITKPGGKPFVRRYELSGKLHDQADTDNWESEEDDAIKHLRKKFRGFPLQMTSAEAMSYDEGTKIASVDVFMTSGDVMNVDYNVQTGQVVSQEIVETRKRGTVPIRSPDDFDYQFFQGNALKAYENANYVWVGSAISPVNGKNVVQVKGELSHWTKKATRFSTATV